MRNIYIGVLGLGNVGAGALKILNDNRESIGRRLKGEVIVKRVLVRSLERPRLVECDPSLLTTNADDIINDPDIRVVAELIGGIEPAREYVLRALQAGKHIVTANKALLAEHGEEIFAEANSRGLSVYFEGSVAGGIPVLRALREGLASDQINGLIGILNGTSNFILDNMTTEGLSYEVALKAAQEAGFAEADPTLDVEGKDSAHKLALLALVSFGLRPNPNMIPTVGITKVTDLDIAEASRLGYVIKSLARARNRGRILHVEPTFVPNDHILAGVRGAFSAVYVESSGLGESLYYGPGAGMMPTGTAVVSDIIEISRDILGFVSQGTLSEAFHEIEPLVPGSLDQLRRKNYVRITLRPDANASLGKIVSCLDAHGVGIERMNHAQVEAGQPVEVVFVTAPVADANLRAAIADIDTLDVCQSSPCRIPIFDSASDTPVSDATPAP